MNLGKYIYELLLEHETVIFPGFGAFVSVYKPAEIQGEVIKPPSKEISFTQQIRNNDGLLVAYVSGKENLSHFDALKMIEKHRENLIYLLEKGDRVVLEKTGTLWFTANHEIQFEPYIDDNLLLDSYGLESISTNLQEVNRNDHDVVDETKQSVIEETKSPDMGGEPEKRKKKGAWWFLLVLIPIILSGVFLLMNERKPVGSDESVTKEDMVVVKKPLPAKPDVLTDDALENKMDRAEAIAENIADSIEAPASQTENELSSETLLFHLVGGGFKEKDNAEDFVAVLKEEGFDSFLLGKRGNFYLVVIGTYSSELEAVRARNVITEKDTAKNLWVLEERAKE